jgi:nitrate reductase alpha subunit
MSKNGIDRRQFLEGAAAAGFATFIGSATRAWGLTAIDNPLAHYPSREWERTYRDLWKYDSTFTFLCAPNDTHNCILNAYVRDGIITRIGPTMRYRRATTSTATAPVIAGTRAFARRAWR